jgi:effector-binding domain-containing protein
MKALKIIVFIVLGIVALLVIVGLILPKSFSVERSVEIDAPPAIVKPQVVKFENFAEWEPWGDADPDMQVTIEGEDGTVGAKYLWKGNDDVDSGIQEIVAMDENRVDVKLTFTEPWETEDKTYYLFDDTEEGTKVTWGMEGNMPFPMNLMTLVMDMEQMIGEQYSEGLNRLKERCEKMASEMIYGGYKIEEVDMPEMTYAIVRKKIPMSMMQSFYAESYGKLSQALEKHSVEAVGAPSGIYFAWDMKTQETDMAAAIPVPVNTEIDGVETVNVKGKALKLEYYGDYENLEDLHMAMDAYMKANNMAPSKMVMEEYVTDPTN